MPRGHVRQRGRESWEVIVNLGRQVDPDTGRSRRVQQSETVRGTKRDADRRLTAILAELDTGRYVRPTAKLTTGEYLHQWLRDYVATNVRARTAQGYRSICQQHLIPGLGMIPLAKLTPGHIGAYHRKALESGRRDGRGQTLSARSVLSHHRVLSKALKTAVEWGILGRNVAEAVRPPRPVQQEMQVLDGDGVAQLLEAAQGTPYHALIHLLLFTGLRRSEALGLRRGDVDTIGARLQVVQVLHHLQDGRTITDAPKTAKSRRSVALSPGAVLALRSHLDQVAADRAYLGLPVSDADLVFAHPDGSPLLPDSVSHAFIKIARRAGFAGITLHGLRHTHATLMLSQGVHPKIVSERLGHSNIGITLDTYSHVLPGLQEAAALRFEEGIARPVENPARV